jgi:hypothetical protein
MTITLGKMVVSRNMPRDVGIFCLSNGSIKKDVLGHKGVKG